MWILPLPQSETVSTGVLINVGVRDEIWPQEAGLAHASEHMHLMGTREFPTSKDISNYIEEVGGVINAWTSKEATFYHNQVPAAHAERAVHLLSQQLRETVFDDKKIVTEMKNIIQELRRENDNPQWLTRILADEFVYGSHPLSRNVLGTEEAISAFTKESFLSFQKRFYDPANFAYVVAGNITPQKALKLFNNYFPEKAQTKPNNRPAIKLAPAVSHQLIKTKKDIEQVYLVLNALTGKAKDKEATYLDFFCKMISGGMSFPLFQEVREKKGLCYEIWATSMEGSDTGIFFLYMGTDPKRCKEAINASLNVIKKHKSNNALLEKVKKMQIGRLALRYESTADIIELAAFDINSTGKPRGYNQILKEIKEIKIRHIKGVVDKYLKPSLIFKTILAPDGFDKKVV